MTHISTGTLAALDASELDQRQRGRAAAHLASCGRCRERLAWVREVRRAARAAAVDPVAAPAGAWEAIRERFERGDVVLLPPLEEPPARAPRRRAAWPAALVLLAAGGAAAAVPASPVRDWIVRAWSATRAPAPEALPTDASPGDAGSAVPEAVLLVTADAGAITIAVERPGADLRIRVREWHTAEAEVRATGAAAGAIFRSAPGRLVIAEPRSGEIQVTLPAAAERVTLEVDGMTYLVKSAGVLRVLAPGALSAGGEIVLPTRSGDH